MEAEIELAVLACQNLLEDILGSVERNFNADHRVELLPHVRFLEELEKVGAMPEHEVFLLVIDLLELECLDVMGIWVFHEFDYVAIRISGVSGCADVVLIEWRTMESDSCVL